MRHCEAQSCNKVSGESPIDFFTHDGRIVAAAVLRAEKLLVSGGGRHQLLRCRGGGRLDRALVAEAAPDNTHTDEC